MAAASLSQLSFLSNPSPRSLIVPSLRPTAPFRRIRDGGSRFRCSAGQTGFFTRLGRLLKEKAKSDVEKIFSGFTKTRDNLAVIDELLLYWNLAETDRVLDELEEVSHLFHFCILFCSMFVSRRHFLWRKTVLFRNSEFLDCLNSNLSKLIHYSLLAFFFLECGFDRGVIRFWFTFVSSLELFSGLYFRE